MKSRILLTLAFALLVAAAFAPRPQAVRAQDAKVACDADLILNLYVAENYFNFGAVHDKLMGMGGDMAKGMVDFSKLDYGQYTPLFDAMMKAMDSSMMTPNAMMSDQTMSGVVDMMSKGDSMMMGDTMGQMTELKPAAMQGEPAECTALRTELNHFYTALAYEGMMMAEATPDAMMADSTPAMK
jgi:hypothetical protein